MTDKGDYKKYKFAENWVAVVVNILIAWYLYQNYRKHDVLILFALLGITALTVSGYQTFILLWLLVWLFIHCRYAEMKKIISY